MNYRPPFPPTVGMGAIHAVVIAKREASDRLGLLCSTLIQPTQKCCSTAIGIHSLLWPPSNFSVVIVYELQFDGVNVLLHTIRNTAGVRAPVLDLIRRVEKPHTPPMPERRTLSCACILGLLYQT